MGAQLAFLFEFVHEEQYQPKKADVIPFEPRIMWTDDEIDALREAVFESSLKALGDTRVGKSTKKEVLEWVRSESNGPFSFNVCAKECGYSPCSLREQILLTIRKAH